MSLQTIMEKADVGCEVAIFMNLHNLCQLRMSSKALNIETIVTNLNDKQRKIICNRTPFAKKSLNAFLIKGPKWMNNFIDTVRSKLKKYDAKNESRLRSLHSQVADCEKTVRKDTMKIRKAPEELEEKIAKLRRTEAMKLNKSKQVLKKNKGVLTRCANELEQTVLL